MATKSSMNLLRCLRTQVPSQSKRIAIPSQLSATRCARYSIIAPTVQRRTTVPSKTIPHTTTASPILTQTRSKSNPTPTTTSPVYDFIQVKTLSETAPSQPPSTQKALLIDVREPHEYTAGHIPTALNLPISSQPDALFLSAEDFLEKFDFPKPDPKDEGLRMVFYCKAGVRSAAAAGIAREAGYVGEGQVGEYRGSWGDWVAKGGKVERA